MRFRISLDDRIIVKWMIKYYCRKKHGGNELCDECSELLNYALMRIEQCPYGKDKPVCSKCRIHCYKPEKRDNIKGVMKFSGSAILLRKPITGLKYLLKKKFYNIE